MEIIVYIVTLFLIKVLVRHLKPQLKGKIGESKVALSLLKLNKNDYIIFNDLHLSHNGYTTQIDHLVLSIHGVFVIETKNYKGWIFGNEKSTYWTQTIYGKRNKLYNPILQNWKHVNFLKRLSPELKSATYFPIVVFTGSGQLKDVETTLPVLYKNNLLRYIRSKKEVVLTHQELNHLNIYISRFLASKKEIKKQHKRSFRTKRYTENRTCPKCGNYLNVKEGKYGSFMGCSSYPKCNFTKKI
jgi:hypothetical protein